MAKTGAFHHVGTFLLFLACILLVVTTISAPILPNGGLLKVQLTNKTTTGIYSGVNFGTFGTCVTNIAGSNKNANFCYKKHIGYNPVKIMSTVDSTTFTTAQTKSAKALTKVMVLHSVACGLAFLAFLFSAGSGCCGAIFAALTSAITWFICLIVMSTDLVLFGMLKRHINRDGSGSHAKYGNAMWSLVAAVVCLFLGTFVVLGTCCSARMHKQDTGKNIEEEYAQGGEQSRNRFFHRRNNY
jgi:hypothetical protein